MNKYGQLKNWRSSHFCHTVFYKRVIHRQIVLTLLILRWISSNLDPDVCTFGRGGSPRTGAENRLHRIETNKRPNTRSILTQQRLNVYIFFLFLQPNLGMSKNQTWICKDPFSAKPSRRKKRWRMWKKTVCALQHCRHVYSLSASLTTTLATMLRFNQNGQRPRA